MPFLMQENKQLNSIDRGSIFVLVLSHRELLAVEASSEQDAFVSSSRSESSIGHRLYE